MADVESIMARLQHGRATTIHVVDPVTRAIREFPVDPAFAANIAGGAVFVPLNDSVGARLQVALRLTDEARVTIDDTIAAMIAECAVTPVGDDVLRHVLGHLVERGFDVVPQEARP